MGNRRRHPVLQVPLLAVQGLAAPDPRARRDVSPALQGHPQGPDLLREAGQHPGPVQERLHAAPWTGNPSTRTTTPALSSSAPIRWGRGTSCASASTPGSTTSKQQGSATAPWETYEHQTYSAGVEDDFRLSDKWQVTGGFSVDRLKKQGGGSRTSLNPIAGIRFTPTPDLSFHLALSRKSRFPSMRSLYSTSGGNPALKDEIGTTVEAGASWEGRSKGAWPSSPPRSRT